MPQRNLGWVSADASGLPIYPGLVKVKEINKGVIDHAIRFSSSAYGSGYVSPASRGASYAATAAAGNAPLGTRARLRASFNCLAKVNGAFTIKTKTARVICTALKKYGMILSDAAPAGSGVLWQLSGEASSSWERLILPITALATDLSLIRASDLEIVVPTGESLSPAACRCDSNVEAGRNCKCQNAA